MAVRMSSIHFLYNYKNALNRTYSKQQRLFEQADGSKIHRGSDDPVAYSNMMRYEFTQNENATYKANVQTANSWMNSSDSVMINMSANVGTLVEKANQAANTYLSESDSQSIAKEMNARIEEIISNCNYQLGDRFLFAGQKDTTQPFTVSSEDVDRGLAKNLDAKQAEFFFGTRGNVNTELYQFLTLKDDTNTYYLDTRDGYIYSKDFIDDGYKDLISQGHNYLSEVDPADYAVGRLGISEEDAQNTVNSSDSDSVLAVVNGTSTNNDLKHALRKIGESENSDTYISNIAGTIDGVEEEDVKAAVSACKNFAVVTVSDYFDNRGVIKEAGTAGISTTLNDDEEATTLNFVTVAQKIVTYSGDANHISMVKLNGATDTRSDIVNLTGQDLWGSDIFDNEDSGNEQSGTAMLNNIITVYAKTNSCDAAWLSSDGITLADVAHSTLNVAETTLGARLQLYDNVDEMLDNQDMLLTTDITDLSGTDVADLATRLMELTTIYNLALSLGGRVLPQSLADYL